MSDLFWPGDERAGEILSEPTFLAAMVRVESAWLGALVSAGVAPAAAATSLSDVVVDTDVRQIALAAESGGNPVIPLVALLRERLAASNPDAARWIHRGLTSQDVVDTALTLCLKDVAARVGEELNGQIQSLADLADKHRTTLMAGRTLTQHAVPIAFGLKVTGWLEGVLDAATDLANLEFPIQVGGATGTMAGPVELLAMSSSEVSVADLTSTFAKSLSLYDRSPWHTTRTPFTRFGDVLVRCTDAWGHIANDVLTLTRPEIGELMEPAGDGRGGSSTMPHKANPVLSTLIKRAALTAPLTGAQLHVAAAGAVDERPDGAWHTEWSTLHTLARRTVVAASQTSELLSGLRVDAERMRATAVAASDDLLAERRSLTTLFPDAVVDDDLATYLGATDQIIDEIIGRARTFLKENS